jgi:hypothetical protein
LKLETQINKIQELALAQENLEKSPEFMTDVKRVKDLIQKMKRDYGDFWESIKREIKSVKVEPEGFWEDAQSGPLLETRKRSFQEAGIELESQPAQKR